MWNLTDKRNVAIRLMSPHDIPSSHQATLLYVKVCARITPFTCRFQSTLIPFTNRTWKCVWGVLRTCVSGTAWFAPPEVHTLDLPAPEETETFTPHLLLRLMHASF